MKKSLHSVTKVAKRWGWDVTWRVHVSPMCRAWAVGHRGRSHKVILRPAVFGHTWSPLIQSDLLSFHSNMGLFKG